MSRSKSRNVRLQLEALEGRLVPATFLPGLPTFTVATYEQAIELHSRLQSITDMSQLADVIGVHREQNLVFLNFEGEFIRTVNDFVQPTVAGYESALDSDNRIDRVEDRDIQEILYRTAQIYAPFNVQVSRRMGADQLGVSQGHDGHTTVYVGDIANDSGVAFTRDSDYPGLYRGMDHLMNSDDYDKAYVDPFNDDHTTQFSNAVIAQMAAHEIAHTFGLAHVDSPVAVDLMNYHEGTLNVRVTNDLLTVTTLNNQGDGAVAEQEEYRPAWHYTIAVNANLIVGRTAPTFAGTIRPATQNAFATLQSVLGTRPSSVSADDWGNVADPTAVDSGVYTDGFIATITPEQLTNGRGSLRGNIERIGDYDVFRIRAVSDAPLIFSLNASEGSGLRPVLMLFDGVGQQLLDYSNRDMGDLGSIVLSNPQPNRTYTLVVGAANNASVGSYELFFEKSRTFTGSASKPLTLTDADGDIYTVKLTGPGQVSVATLNPDVNGRGAIEQIIVQGTDPLKSSLSVTVKKALAGDGIVSIGAIQGGGLKSIQAKSADLEGAGINLAGPLGSLTLHDVKNGADITAGGTVLQKTVISAHVIDAGTYIDLGSSISSLTVSAFGAGGVSAPAIGKLTVTGDHRLGIVGNFDADLGSTLEPLSLKSAAIAGGITDAVWSILGDVASLSLKGDANGWHANISGNLASASFASVGIGSSLAAASIRTLTSTGAWSADLTLRGTGDPKKPALTSAKIQGGIADAVWTILGNNSAKSVAVTGGVSNWLFSADEGTIAALTVNAAKGVTTPAYVNSDVMARNIGRVKLASVQTDNAGDPFGIHATNSLGSVTAGTPGFAYDPANPDLQGIGDFEVGKV